MYKSVSVFAAIFATTNGLTLKASSTHEAKTYSEDNKTKLTSSISN